MKNTDALIIMAKEPRSENVKTRLKGILTDDQRVGLYVWLLEGAVGKLREIRGVDTYLTYSPPGAEEYFSRYGLPAFSQMGGDLGERMHNALSSVLDKGYARAVLVGVDIPGLNSGTIMRAFELLSSYDVVFGPAEDGGYYLVGLKAPSAALFRDVEWSSRSTLKHSMENADSLGMSTALTKTLYDIDSAEGLERLRREGISPV